MGVLRFFRHIALKFPECLISLKGTFSECEKATSKGVASEWLSLDLNSIFHPAVGELHTPPKFIKSLLRPRAPPLPPAELSENVIFAAICKRLEQIVKIIDPSKGIYFAVDGTAGCSKCVQQKKRRFKTASERKQTPGIVTWDSTKISCGTEFMERLNQHIVKWIEQHTKSGWKSLQIIFSSHRIVGEGEHKIRFHMKDNPNVSFTVVSPDADLIFLTSALPNSQAWIFRENIFDDIEGNFFLVDIAKFRTCIIMTINPDSEKHLLNHKTIIDDFTIYCFGIGNDFLPSIPSINVANEGIELLLVVYPEVVRKHGSLSQISSSGQYSLRKESMIEFFRKMAETEVVTMIENFRKSRAKVRDSIMKKYLTNDNDIFELDIEKYKKEYYHQKFGGIDSCVIVHEYLRGMIFVARYYLEQIPSWEWVYPFLYAPFFSDLAIHAETFDWECKFEPSTPFTPFEQLLSILPPQSARFLPECLRELTTSSSSSIIDLFPQSFEVDLEGKKDEHEGIILLPSVEPERIRSIFLSLKDKLSDAEKIRNESEKLFVYNPDSSE